jgi:UDP-glucose 4-epimerase
VVAALQQRGDEVVVADDLSAGDAGRIGTVPLERIDLAGGDATGRLAQVMRDRGVDAVIHLAARKKVGESVERPVWYYEQNIGGLAAVLAAAEQAGVQRAVFSSTAAVYAPSETPVDEDAPTAPPNPYGATKLVGVWLLRDQAAVTGLRAISLRYFNVAGAARPDLADTAESNIVPMVFAKLENGEAPEIFGDDYATPDGTCVRDYVHVADVADAHLAALDSLGGDAPAYRTYNIGTGRGVSVREMVAAMTTLSGRDIQPAVLPRRPGDPAIVVADAGRIAADLGWRARHDLDEMLTSAWESRSAR